MDVKQILAASLLCGIAACATVETAADHARDFAHKHPVVTGVGVALVAGGIAVAVNNDHHHHEVAPIATRRVHESPCSPQGLTPC